MAAISLYLCITDIIDSLTTWNGGGGGDPPTPIDVTTAVNMNLTHLGNNLNGLSSS